MSAESTQPLQLSEDAPLIPADPHTTIRKGSLPGSVANLLNTMIGAGILALPFAFKSSGLALGSVLLFFVSCLQGLSLHLLLRCRVLSGGVSTYEDIGRFTFGPRMATAVKVIIVLQTFGVITAYLMIAGDLTPTLLNYLVDTPAWYTSRTIVIIALSLFVQVPLCLLRRLNSLRYTSFLAMTFMLYLTAYVVSRAGTIGFTKDPVAFRWDRSVFLTVPIISLAYTCHMNLFPIHNELTQPTRQRGAALVNATVFSATCLYALVASFGYVTFYEDTLGNLLINYSDSHDAFIIIGRLGVIVTVTLSIPVGHYPCRQSLDMLLFAPPSNANPDDPKQPGDAVNYEIPTRRFVGEALLIISLATLLAVLLEDISVVLDFLGSTVSTALSYVFPAMFYLRLTHWSANPNARALHLAQASYGTRDNNDASVEAHPRPAASVSFLDRICMRCIGSPFQPSRWHAYVLWLAGVLFGIIGFVETFAGLVSGQGH